MSNSTMSTVLGTRNSDGTISVARQLTSVPISSRRGRLSPRKASLRSVAHGRRRCSPYQARALASGIGVVVNPDEMNFTMSPQDASSGCNAANWTATGFSTSEIDPRPSQFVHITFPEWVQ